MHRFAYDMQITLGPKRFATFRIPLCPVKTHTHECVRRSETCVRWCTAGSVVCCFRVSLLWLVGLIDATLLLPSDSVEFNGRGRWFISGEREGGRDRARELEMEMESVLERERERATNTLRGGGGCDTQMQRRGAIDTQGEVKRYITAIKRWIAAEYCGSGRATQVWPKLFAHAMHTETCGMFPITEHLSALLHESCVGVQGSGYSAERTPHCEDLPWHTCFNLVLSIIEPLPAAGQTRQLSFRFSPQLSVCPAATDVYANMTCEQNHQTRSTEA